MKTYIALVKKQKKKTCIMFDIIKLYVILVLQILLLYIELLPVGRDWPAITTLCQWHAVLWFIICHWGHWKAILAWMDESKNLSLDPSLHSINLTPSSLPHTSTNLEISSSTITCIICQCLDAKTTDRYHYQNGYRKWLHVNLKKFYS